MFRFRVGFWKDKPRDGEETPYAEYIIDSLSEKDAWLLATERFQSEHPDENLESYTIHSENAP